MINLLKKIFIGLFVYMIISNIILVNRINEVKRAKYDLQVAIERNNEILTRSIKLLNEVSKYNIYMSDRSDKALLNLNKKLDDYQIESTGSKNRIAICKNRLSKSIAKYNNVVNNPIFFIVKLFFGFHSIEYDSAVSVGLDNSVLVLIK